MNQSQLRELFPNLSVKVYGKPLVYFDNAATSHRPQSVISKWEEMALRKNANIHRAVHSLSSQATEEVEKTRDYIKDYLNAADRSEIIFTSGATASVNLVAFSFGEAFVGEGDEIIVSESGHHSNIVPWQMLCQRKKANIRVLHVDEDGIPDVSSLRTMLSSRTKIVAVSHISNVLGLVNPVKEICRICHESDVPVLVDGAQGIVHCKVDVQDLGCDFYVFSGHKVYAATGTGVLWGRKSLLDKMPPYMGGGEMIETVSFSGTTFAPAPAGFEAGTQNILSMPTLVPAIGLQKEIFASEAYKQYEAVGEYLYEKLSSDPRIKVYGVPRGTVKKVPLFSFTVQGAHHEDLALILDKMGIAVRSGQMCAEPLMDRFGVSGMLRASLAPYNTMQEAELFIKSLDKAINMLA